MSRQAKAHHRAVRIELLRARAALERQSLCQYSRALGQQLQPGNLLSSVTPEFSARGVGTWVQQAFRLSRRYPFLLSSASSVLSMFGGRWVKVAAVGLLGWRLFASQQDKQERRLRRSLVPVRRTSDDEY